MKSTSDTIGAELREAIEEGAPDAGFWQKDKPLDFTLEDVLSATRFWKTGLACDCDGLFWRIHGKMGEPWKCEIYSPRRWSLGKPLSEQSDEMKRFLHSVFCAPEEK